MTAHGNSSAAGAGIRSDWTRQEIDYLARALGSAPSVHNTRPSRVVFGHRAVELYELPARRLAAHDPDGRDRRISCGAALSNLELAVRAVGWSADVTVYPDAERSDLIGRIRAEHRQAPSADVRSLAAAMPRRHSHRHPFTPVAVSERAVERLRRAAGPAVTLHRIRRPHEVAVLAELLEYAGRVLRDDHGLQRELAGWTVRPGELGPLGLPLGIPDRALSREPLPTAGLVHRGTPLADCVVLAGRIAEETILVLCTPGDSRAEHVEAGRAVERLWLAAIGMDLAGSVLTQPLQLSEVRARLRRDLDLPGHPQLLFRVGHPSNSAGDDQESRAETVSSNGR